MMTDLVINHTAKDCPLVTSHPDWYRRDARGELVSPSAIDPAKRARTSQPFADGRTRPAPTAA